MISANQTKKGDRLERLSLDPLTPDDALRGAMEVDPPKQGKAKKRKTKRAKKKRARKK